MHKDFSDDAWADYTYWITQDKKTLKKINQLLADIERNGNDGIIIAALANLSLPHLMRQSLSDVCNNAKGAKRLFFALLQIILHKRITVKFIKMKLTKRELHRWTYR